jgi:hypothetical protein
MGHMAATDDPAGGKGPPRGAAKGQTVPFRAVPNARPAPAPTVVQEARPMLAPTAPQEARPMLAPTAAQEARPMLAPIRAQEAPPVPSSSIAKGARSVPPPTVVEDGLRVRQQFSAGSASPGAGSAAGAGAGAAAKGMTQLGPQAFAPPGTAPYGSPADSPYGSPPAVFGYASASTPAPSGVVAGTRGGPVGTPQLGYMPNPARPMGRRSSKGLIIGAGLGGVGLLIFIVGILVYWGSDSSSDPVPVPSAPPVIEIAPMAPPAPTPEPTAVAPVPEVPASVAPLPRPRPRTAKPHATPPTTRPVPAALPGAGGPTPGGGAPPAPRHDAR